MRLKVAAVAIGLGAAMVVPVVSTAAVAVAGAQPAVARCKIDGFSPRSVTLGKSPVTKTFSISTSSCTRKDWYLSDSGTPGFYTSDGSPQDTFDPSYLSNSDAGTSSVVASAYNSDYNETERSFVDAFDLRRRVEVSTQTNASPEPVHKGGKVTITARLKVVDWDAYPQEYVSFTGHTVQIQFRTPSGKYTTVKSAKTDSTGTVKTTATQKVSGLWRVVYGGTKTFSAATAVGDSVKVS